MKVETNFIWPKRIAIPILFLLVGFTFSFQLEVNRSVFSRTLGVQGAMDQYNMEIDQNTELDELNTNSRKQSTLNNVEKSIHRIKL